MPKRIGPDFQHSEYGRRNTPDDDNDESGPESKCCLCCQSALLATFIVSLLLMIIYPGVMYGSYHGSTNRIFHGYDVRGDTCGQTNVPIPNVELSGRDWTAKPVLQFDISRTMTILADVTFQMAEENRTSSAAGTTTQAPTPPPQYDDLPSLGNYTDFCLLPAEDVKTTTVSPPPNEAAAPQEEAAAAADETDPQLSLLVQKYRALVIGQRQSSTTNGTMTALLTGDGMIRVFSHVSDEETDNSSGQMEVVFGYVERALMNPLPFLVTGGGSCRYCVRQCPKNTTQVLFLCLPTVEAINGINSILYSDSGTEDWVVDAIEDVKLCWNEIGYMVGLGLVFSLSSFGFFAFLPCLLFQIIFYIFFVISALAGTITLWYLYVDEAINDTLTNTTTTIDLLLNDTSFNDANIVIRILSSYVPNRVNNYLWGAVFCTIITVSVILLAKFQTRQSRVVLLLFSASTRAVFSFSGLKLAFIVVVFLTVLMGLVTAWVFALVVAGSSGEPDVHPETGFVTYQRGLPGQILDGFYVVWMWWVVSFVVACFRYSVASVLAAHFKETIEPEEDLPASWCSSCRACFVTSGSLACGSFLYFLSSTLCAPVKYLGCKLEAYGYGDLKDAAADGGDCCRNFCYCTCCEDACEKKLLLYFDDKRAYDEIAIEGCKTYCRAAEDAFNYLPEKDKKRNKDLVDMVQSIGGFIFYVGKVVIVLGSMMAGAAFIQLYNLNAAKVVYMWVPLGVGGLLVYVVADAIYGTFEEIMYTVIHFVFKAHGDGKEFQSCCCSCCNWLDGDIEKLIFPPDEEEAAPRRRK